EGRIGISKYLLVNPPLDLGHALRKVDEWHAFAAHFGVDRSNGLIAKALAIVESFSREQRDDPAVFDRVAKDFASFTRDELQFLIAEDLYSALPELVYVTQIIQAQKTEPSAQSRAKRRFRQPKDLSFASYRKKVALPVWRRQAAAPRADLESFLERGSLTSILDKVRGNSKVHIVHNADDCVDDRRSIEELKEGLGGQMTLYPYGGHLGNLWYAENREAILRFFQTVSETRHHPSRESREGWRPVAAARDVAVRGQTPGRGVIFFEPRLTGEISYAEVM